MPRALHRSVIVLLAAALCTAPAAANDWPQFEMAEALRNRTDGPLAFVLSQPLLLSVTLCIHERKYIE